MSFLTILSQTKYKSSSTCFVRAWRIGLADTGLRIELDVEAPEKQAQELAASNPAMAEDEGPKQARVNLGNNQSVPPRMPRPKKTPAWLKDYVWKKKNQFARGCYKLITHIAASYVFS